MFNECASNVIYAIKHHLMQKNAEQKTRQLEQIEYKLYKLYGNLSHRQLTG